MSGALSDAQRAVAAADRLVTRHAGAVRAANTDAAAGRAEAASARAGAETARRRLHRARVLVRYQAHVLARAQ